jgi:transcriptional pleiotropic regulator of transition state genes
MKTGIKRRVDELGRIVLPIEIRRNLEINERDVLEISIENDKVVLKKAINSCVFCSSQIGLTTYMNKHICSKCKKELTE